MQRDIWKITAGIFVAGSQLFGYTKFIDYQYLSQQYGHSLHSCKTM